MRSYNLQGSAPFRPSRPADEIAPPDKVAADVLAGQICHAASLAAQAECALLELIGEFDATDAIRWWTDVKSVAHWLAWSCSMSPGTAREHVRVARALRRMPTVLAEFRAGRLSYSKVREVTRVVDVVDEARLCQLALTATASQLARMIRGFRTADGLRLPQEVKRQVSWHRREDGMVDVRGCLPAEDAALLLAAVTAAKERFGTPPGAEATAELTPEPGADPTPKPSARYTNADALLELARIFLDTTPADRSGEDRTLVVVQVAAETLVGDVPAGTPVGTEVGVPAGTSLTAGTCHLPAVGPVEAETARRLACDADLVGAIVDQHGDVLALGRTRRLVSRAQRRALMIRDRMCRFPGCDRTRHLKAHHVISWARGGPTDLDNLILLCQWHHTAVHEGGITIHRTDPTTGPSESRWQFRTPDGKPYAPWLTAERLPQTLLRLRIDPSPPAPITGFDDPRAKTIRPRWSGERPDLGACVEALFTMKLATSEVVEATAA